MPLSLEQAAGQQFMLSFLGKQHVPAELRTVIERQHVGGIALFRAKNMGTLKELRELTAGLQCAARMASQPPLLIAADQEGGQLMAIGQATPFPGNMALGAAGSDKLGSPGRTSDWARARRGWSQCRLRTSVRREQQPEKPRGRNALVW